MTDTTALRDLLKKVKAGWPPDIDTAYMPPFTAVFGIGYQAAHAWKANDGDTNVAIDLCQSVTPGWDWSVCSSGADLYNPGVEGDRVVFSHSGEPARSLLICVLKAMIWESEQ